MYDRFNLEEEIQNVWHTKEDLDAIAERVYDDPDGPMTEDEIGNVLIGLSELHETRCKKLSLIIKLFSISIFHFDILSHDLKLFLKYHIKSPYYFSFS